MSTLDAALGAMRDAKRFFIYRLVWNAKKAKYEKTPCPADGSSLAIDASDSSNWISYAEAKNALAALPYTPALCYALGYWFAEGSGYFFLDIDNCRDTNGNLSALAQQLINMFPGAFVEWSSSQKGLHIIGRAALNQHRSRSELGLELYSKGRGIAFGLTGVASGCADTVHDAAITQLVAQYFQPTNLGPGENSVRSEWTGPRDDNELITRMLNARQSAAVAFGNKISLRDLWEGRAEKNSENDMALAAHLAYWTGCNGERMERLMQRSGLVREKWAKHRTYLQMTIAKACSTCSAVHKEVTSSASREAEDKIRSASDLMREKFSPVQWALRGILPEGVTILSGDPKIGKSWLVYQMCVAIATGSPLWPGRQPEATGDALMLALEDNERRLQRRLEKLLPIYGGKVPLRLYYATEWMRAERGVSDIAAWLRDHPECRIVVIDTISAFRDNDPGRKSAYAHDYSVGEMLKPLAREFHCAIVLVMHNRKQAAGDVMHKVSGTQGMTGSVDNVLVLERSRGGMDAALHVDGRDIEEPAQLAMRFEGGNWRSLGDVTEVQRSKERTAVLQALSSLGGAATAKAIFEAIGGADSLSAIRMRLSRMVKAGELKNENGIYKHPLCVSTTAELTLPPLPALAT